MPSVPSLVVLCVQVLARYSDQLSDVVVDWLQVPLRENVEHDILTAGLDVDAWTVLIHLFTQIPAPLCSFTTSSLPKYSHGFLTVLSLPSSNHLTFSLLRSTPTLAALDASSTSLSALPSSLVHLRVLYLRNCRKITDDILPTLLSLPLLSVIDLTATNCSRTISPFPFTPSPNPNLFQPSIQASLSALAALYPSTDFFPSPLYTLTYLVPRPPKPTPRIGTQDSFVVFSSSSTKMGNTNSLIYEEEHPDSYPIRYSFSMPLAQRPLPSPFPFSIKLTHTSLLNGSRPRPVFTLSPFHLHRPPPPLSSLHQHIHAMSTQISQPKPKPSSSVPASLNLRNQKAELARKGMEAFIKLRSTTSTPTLLNPEPTSKAPFTTKNPFRKSSLKPISSFPPPILPPSLAPSPLPRKKPKLTTETKPPSKTASNPKPKLVNRDPTTSFDWKAWSSGPSQEESTR